MRIAMIHWGYPPVIGGVETHLALLGPALVREGHTVGLLTGAHADSPNSLVDGGVSITRLPIMDLNWLYRRGFANLEDELRKSVNRFLDELKADVIHVHNMHYFSELHAKIVEAEARRRNIPLILSAHNVWADSQCLKLTRDIKWDKVISVSDYIKRSLEAYGLDGGIVVTVHHGIDGEPFFNAEVSQAYAKYPELQNKRILFHPARMGLAKGSDIVVQAFRLIKEKVSNTFLVLAGTKNIIDWGESQQRDIAYVLELLDLFNLRSDTLIDQYPMELMPAMYAASEVVVYPSTFPEPFGITMLEAFASGKPLIVSRSGGMPEVVEHAISGYVINPSDHVSLAETAIQLFENPALAKKIGEKGHEVFRQQFCLEKMVDRIIQIYQESMTAKRA